MGLILTCLACLILYSKSKYFPAEWKEVKAWTTSNRKLTRIVGYFMLAISLTLYIIKYGQFTGMIIWLVVLMFSFGAMVMLVPTLSLWRENKS